MATIRDHVRANLGETYEKLVNVAGYDSNESSNGASKPDVVGLKQDAIFSRLFASDVVEGNLSEFARAYLGVLVTRALIPLAIDFYMVQTKVQENLSRPAGTVPLGGETAVNYDRVSSLRRIDELLAEQEGEWASDFYDDVTDLRRGGPGSALLGVSSNGRFRTQDPYDTMPSIVGRRVYGGEFGVVWVGSDD